MKSLVTALLLTALMAVLHPDVAGAQTLSGLAGDAVLTVSNGVPQTTAGGVAAPMPVMLLKESFEATLNRNGTSLAAWANACRTLQPSCGESLRALEPVVVDAKVAPANDARATFGGVPPGSYYVFGQSRYGNQFLVWDVRIDLQSGPNAITLDQRNIAPLDSARPRTPTPAPPAPPGR